MVEGGRRILSNVVLSQVDIHGPYGGIVPELASRHHMGNLNPVIRRALVEAGTSMEELDAIAVTIGPGLIGALLVGLSTAKGMAYALSKPLLGVNHLEGHISAVFLEDDPPLPFVALVVSGGHTDLYWVGGFNRIEILGRTRDDAAGECFDKAAKILGLGYPGGPVINRLSAQGDPKKILFPRPMASQKSFDFSFSGLKTSLKTWVASHLIDEEKERRVLPDLAASFQEAVVDVLVSKAFAAAAERRAKALVVSGGVACNTRLRERLREEGTAKGIPVFIPSPALCADNAAMIAAAAAFQPVEIKSGKQNDFFSMDACANLEIARNYA